jgi:hypothetical protein
VIQWYWLREYNIEYAMTIYAQLARIKTSSGKEREYLEQINKLLVEKNALVGANAQWEKDVKFLNDELNDIREKYASVQKVWLLVAAMFSPLLWPKFTCYAEFFLGGTARWHRVLK